MPRLSPVEVTRLREMIEASTPYSAICAEVGCTKSTVSYHAAQLGLASSKRKHNWALIRVFYEADHSAHATRREFQIHKKTWQDAIKRGDIIARPKRSWVRSIPDVMSAPLVTAPA